MTPEAISNQYADTNLLSLLELEKPQILNTLFKRYGDQGKMWLRIKSFGFESPVMNDEYSHFEEDHYHDFIVVKTTISGGDSGYPGTAGTAGTFKLDSTKFDSNRKYYPKPYDEVMFSNEVVAWITGITDDTSDIFITVKPNKVTESLPNLTAGEEIIIHSASWTEGSGIPDPTVSGVTKFTNEAGIIKETIGSTGTGLTTESYLSIMNQAGEVQGYMLKEQAAIDYRMLTKLEGAFLFNKRISNAASRALNSTSGYIHKATEGLVPTMRTYGNTDGYTIGAFALTEFDAYARTLKANYVSTTIPIWTAMGLNLYQEVENALRTQNDYATDYTTKVMNDRLFRKDESLAVSVNFKYYTKSGYTFALDCIDGFSNPQTYGATGYDFKNMGWLIPLTKRKDPKTKNDIPSIGIRYRSMGSHNRRFKVGKFVGFGSNLANETIQEVTDRRREMMLAHEGAEFFGVNQFILIDPS